MADLNLFSQKYGLPLSNYDHELFMKLEVSRRETFIQEIQPKYEISRFVLESVKLSSVEKSLTRLREAPVGKVRVPLNRLVRLVNYLQQGFLDEALFDRLHGLLITVSHRYKAFISLVNQARDQHVTPENFRLYLRSGLFEQEIYTLRAQMSDAERQTLLQSMETEVKDLYQQDLCVKDREFLLRNQLQNQHVLHEILIPKYRVFYEIEKLLKGPYLSEVLQPFVDMGLNYGVPLLKRSHTLAEWASDGFLSHGLVQWYFNTLIHDVDELEELFSFLMEIGDSVVPARALHYLELGLFELTEQHNFSGFQEVERHLSDLTDMLMASVQEYINLMSLPATHSELLTNERLTRFYQQILQCAEKMVGDKELIHAGRYVKRIRETVLKIELLHQESASKNQAFPGKKPYGVIEALKNLLKINFEIEWDNLLSMSQFLIKHMKELLASGKIPADSVMAQIFSARMSLIEKARQQPHERNVYIAQMIPLGQFPLFTLSEYINRPRARS
ncbi:MAG: hypothetical protein HQM12_06380 [SAR324 cluster bacterium]|nr:hypothetical protein [SAR324 cluster bacterium]